MVEFLTVAKLEDLRTETGFGVRVKGRPIGLFLHEGQVHAIDDICPHQGALLSDGQVRDGVITCSKHGWRFRISDGTWANVPGSKRLLKHYRTRLEGNQVLLEVDWE